jgi:hypothetical protein
MATDVIIYRRAGMDGRAAGCIRRAWMLLVVGSHGWRWRAGLALRQCPQRVAGGGGQPALAPACPAAAQGQRDAAAAPESK